jgi:SAM-dependent methyltransferase
MNTSELASLVCPLCKHRLITDGALRCSSCGRRFPQPDPRWIDLLPDAWATRLEHWSERQRDMQQAYDELAADPAHARLAYHTDLDVYRSHLARCVGRVLDIGGGYGIVRHYLDGATDYTVLDPSTSWFAQPWHSIADEFPCLAAPPAFVRGVAELMPFPDASVDWILSFWSINHLDDPGRALAECARVLRPGGGMLVSLDDMEPRWTDITSGAYVDRRFPTRSALVRAKLRAPVAGWPLQPDHIRITERDLRRWTPLLRWEERCWVGTYLTLVLRRDDAPLIAERAIR